MRLVCPNCEAKYEVPDDAIPDTGRDVQCASCGHAWFQMRPRSGAAEAVASPVPEVISAPVAEPVAMPEVDSVAEPVAELPSEDVVAEAEAVPEPVAEPEPETGLAPEPEPEVGALPDPEPEGVVEAASVDLPAEPVDAAADDGPVHTPDIDAAETDAPVIDAPVIDAEDVVEASADDALTAVPVAETKAPYAVDDSVLAILREEAERESNARRADARPLEVQADLGIDSAVAAVVPAAAAAPVVAEDKPSARRDLLPDVEEINSTLRPSETEGEVDADAAEMASVAQRRGGFRSGFLWVMTIAMLGAGLYLSAPALSRSFPALAGPLEGYVGTVNGLRLELDGLMRSATVALDGE